MIGEYQLTRYITAINALIKLRVNNMISNYFTRKEFECKCGCGFATVDVELLEVLEFVRVSFNKPVTINSACRCDSHNSSVGGADGSKHKLGIAADIVVKDIDPLDVYKFLDAAYPVSYGIGKYNSFTHIDVRSGYKARW